MGLICLRDYKLGLVWVLLSRIYDSYALFLIACIYNVLFRTFTNSCFTFAMLHRTPRTIITVVYVVDISNF